jgi:tetratricopeptide (TPR) repeat protein
MKRCLLRLGMVISLAGGAWGAPEPEKAQALFAEANELYKNEQYQPAIAVYQSIIDSLHIRNAAVYYNLGNCHYRAGNLGRALVNYGRARRLAPQDEDIVKNLMFVEVQVKDQFVKEQRFVVFRWLASFTQGLSVLEWLFFFDAAYIICVAAGLVLLLVRRELSVVRTVCVIALIAALVTGGFLAGRIYQTHFVKEAIIIQPKADIYSGPAEKYTLRFVLHEGAPLVVQKESEGWYLVRLPDGERGWIKSELVDIL